MIDHKHWEFLGHADQMQGASVFSTAGDASTTEDIAALIQAHYGLVGDLVKLRSERDENFLVTATDGSEHLFKLAHPAEDRAIVDFQTKALQHVATHAPTVPIQRLVTSASGMLEIASTGRDGRIRQGRLFTYLPGVPMSQFPRTAAHATVLGAVAGELDRALLSYEHPASEHDLLWDIQKAVQTRTLLAHTVSTEDRQACERAIDRFERRVLQGGFVLRRQVIHNDLNPHNVLVDRVSTDELTGIIDFGDAVRAPLVNELAVAGAYLLAASKPDLGFVPECVAAYHSVNPLERCEISVLPELIAVRQAMSIAITNWRAMKYPENRDYILRNQQSTLSGLRKLSALREGLARDELLDRCAMVRP